MGKTKKRSYGSDRGLSVYLGPCLDMRRGRARQGTSRVGGRVGASKLARARLYGQAERARPMLG